MKTLINNDLKESAYNYVAGETTGTFYTAERKWITKINRLKEKYPDLVNIQHINSDGSIVVHIPPSWFKINPPKVINTTEEQKEIKKQILANARLSKAKKTID